MLRSYLKLAWKVLRRRPFFTAISLFGISFTLLILLVVVAFVDHAVGVHAPEKKLDRLLYATLLKSQYGKYGWSNGPLSAHLIDAYIRPMKTVQDVALFSATVEAASAYTNDQQIKLDVRYTDGSFWRVLDFDFLEGRGYSRQEVGQAARVVVINARTARAYFGTDHGVVGRPITIDLVSYRVAGVVADVPGTRLYSYADVWLPYPHYAGNTTDSRLSGSYFAALLAPTAAARPAVQAEFAQMAARLPNADPKNITGMYLYADPLLNSFTRTLYFDGSATSHTDNMGLFVAAATVLGLFFLTLPALNLMNLNVTRVLERASEIGVRKAFGATGRDLVGQFLVENVVLALVGGALGLALAAGALHLISQSGLIPYAQLTINGTVVLWGLGLAVLFGLLSGVYPAWRMSRLHPLEALRGTAK